MPNSVVRELMEHVGKLREEVASLKTDMIWIKRGLYVVCSAVAGQAATSIFSLFK